MNRKQNRWYWIAGLAAGALFTGWMIGKKHRRQAPEAEVSPAWANHSRFNKRIFAGPDQLRQELDYLLNHPAEVKAAMRGRGTRVNQQFKERIMLAVTGVNGCRYCSFGHARQAAQIGLSEQEIAQLLAGDLEQVDPAEAVALAFATHYADTGGDPTPAMVTRLESSYEPETASDILIYIRMIMLGNLAGNTFDALLSRLQGAPAENSSLKDELATLALLVVSPIPVGAALLFRMARVGEPRPTRRRVIVLQQ